MWWMNKLTWDTTCQTSGLCLVYSQHWLLFTGSHTDIKLSYKWLLQFMALCAQLTTCYGQLGSCRHRGGTRKVGAMLKNTFQRLLWSMHVNPAAGNEIKITWLKGSVALTSKHFCHQHWGIHIKRSTFRYLFTSFGLKVREFPFLGKAWVERGRRLMI